MRRKDQSVTHIVGISMRSVQVQSAMTDNAFVITAGIPVPMWVEKDTGLAV